MSPMDYHRKSLASLCRICSKTFSHRWKRSFKCSDHASAIKDVFSVDVTVDQGDIHPPNMCQSCFNVTVHYRAAVKAGRQYSTVQKASSWSSHVANQDSCLSCSLYTKGTKGGRNPAKKSKRGRPKLDSSRLLWDFLNSMAPPSLKIPEMPKLFPDYVVEKDVAVAGLVCALCGDIVDRPIDTICHHLVCMSCLIDQYDSEIQPNETDWICSAVGCNEIFRRGIEKASFHDKVAFFAPHGVIGLSLARLKVHIGR